MANGKKTGGRQKGVPNKATAEKAAEVAASGQTPLDFLLEVMRDGAKEPEVRLDAAKAAAPYVHPKLAAVDVNANLSGKIVFHMVTGVPRTPTADD